MRTIGTLICYVLLSFLTGCLESQFDTNDLVSENDLLYLDNAVDKSTYPNHPYEIISITPNEEIWDVIVQYPGGCEEHTFYTHWNDKVEYVQNFTTVSFMLLHNNNGDACERLVKDTLSIDLNRVMGEVYNSQSMLEITAINAFNGREVTVDPYISTLYQGSNCLHSASLLGTTCNNGIWQNQWFLLKDTVGIYDKVWIQPVRADDDRIPPTGLYKVGFKLLFGFRFDEKVCDEETDSIIVPAAITCADLVE